MGFEQAKEFLKPTAAKLGLFVILIVLGGWYGFFILHPQFTFQTGFPVPFLVHSCFGYYGQNCVEADVWNWPKLAFDAAFWYLAAAALAHAYKRMKK